MMLNESTDIQNVGRLLRQVSGKRWWLLLIQVAATGTAVFCLFFLPKIYQSTTTIKVEKERVINPLTRGQAASNELEEKLKTLRLEILSRDYMDKVVNRLGLEKKGASPAAHEALIKKLLDNTEVELNPKEIDTFKIYFAGEDPRQVRDITNVMAGIFIEESLASKENEAGLTVSFLSEQLDIYRRRLEESEAVLRRFEEQHVDELPSTKSAYLARLDVLRVSLDEVRGALHQAKLQKEALIQKLPGEMPAVGKSPDGTPLVPNPLGARLREKETLLGRMLQDYSESYPDVAVLKSEIEGLKKQIAARPLVPASEVSAAASHTVEQTIIDQLQKIDVELLSLNSRQAQLEGEINRLNRRVQTIPQMEQEMVRLKRDYEVNKDIYDNFLRKVEEARVARELETAKKGDIFRILQTGSLPLVPFKPNRLVVVALGVALGLAVNLLLVYWLSLQDTALRTISAAQEFLGLKVLAGIPVLTSGRDRAREFANNVLFGLAGAVYVILISVFLFMEEIRDLLKAMFAGGA